MTVIISPASAMRKIANELFGPSDELLLQVALEGSDFLTRLPLAARQTIEQEPFRSRVTILKEGLDWARANHGAGAEVEARLQINRFQARPGDAPAMSGQIRWVDALDLDEPESEFRTTTPLLVLLDQLRDADSAEPVWNGWVATRHAEFAGWWDMVLQGDEVPGDVAMVQCWNRVSVAGAHLGSTLYQLAPAELQAVCAVWDEYVGSAPEDAESEWSESVVGYLQPRETLGGIVVITGTPLASESDVRLTFESLTRRAGGVVTSACRALVQRSSAAERSFVTTKLHALLDDLMTRLHAEFGELRTLTVPGVGAGTATVAATAGSTRRIGAKVEKRVEFSAGTPALELAIQHYTNVKCIPCEDDAFDVTAAISVSLLPQGQSVYVGAALGFEPPQNWVEVMNGRHAQIRFRLSADTSVVYVVRPGR